MTKCDRPATARAHVEKMFTYIKFDDGVKAVINTDDIVDFDVQNVQFDKKYQVKWDDGHFYYGILGKMQQKIILEETKEAVDEKIKSRRVEFAPLNLCISATEIDTESDLDRGNSFKEESLKNRVATKIKKINIELERKENTNNATTSNIVNGINNTKKTKLKDLELNINHISEKKGKQKENIKNHKQQNGINKPLVIAKNVTSSKQSISKIKETNKLREFKLCKAGNCTQDGKSDNTEFVSCIEEVVAPNKKEIVSPATNTKRVPQLCSTIKLIDCSIVDNNIATSITKNQSYTNKKANETKSLHKTHHENNHIPAGFKHKIKETLSKKNNNAQSQPKTNQDDILKKKIEKLRKTNEDLETKNMKLKNQIKDKERIINDLMSLNMELQNKVIEEYSKLHQINEEIGIKVLSNFDELMHLMSEYFKRHPMNHEDRVGDLPVGYRNIERNEVLGYGVYICARQYDAVCVISKTLPQFVKNLAVAVFGIKTLKESSVTGARSNRNRNKTQEAPRPALDSTKLQALRAIVKHYAMSEKGQDEIAADYEAQQIGTHIAHKIYELNHPPNRNKIQHKKVVPVAQVCEVMNNSEKTSDIDDPEQNSVPNNENSNASSSSHSVTEVNNNNASKEHGSFESSLSDNNTENECHKDVTLSDKNESLLSDNNKNDKCHKDVTLSDKDEKESTVTSIYGTSNTSIDGTDNESD